MATMDIIEREDVLGHLRRVAPRFRERLAALEASPIIGDARGVGLLGCLEGLTAGRHTPLGVQRDLGARLDSGCEARGLILRPLINMAVFPPPLVISEAEIDGMFEIFEDAEAEVAAAIAAGG
jgi:adenosylmethionine-8-amino-7-oxononanoate aminotransferase